MDQIRETWRRLDLRRRAILIGAGAITLLAVLSLAQIASRPSMALLYSGLDPATAGEVVGALEQMGVASEVRGDAIFVEEAARDRVRLQLAREGLPRQGQAGYELLDQISGFSATADMFDAAYWRAKEGELARTITASAGVRSARVHIAVPGRRPFARATAPVTASVTVTMAGGTLSQAQARAIRFLVALAVADLDPIQVAVIDSRQGIVLAPGGEEGAPDIAGTAQEREAKLKAEIEELIAARVGRDRSRVSVSVETDREAETVIETIIEPESQVTISANTEELSDQSQGARGAVTVASNLPDGDAAEQPGSTSARTETRETVNYDYSEVRRERVRQAGAIRRISVAVLVDGILEPAPDGSTTWQPRSDEELAAIGDLVKAAVGFDAARGDVVTVESLAFEPDATPGTVAEADPVARFLERNAITLIQLGVLALVALVLILTVVRPLLLRRIETDGALLAAPGAGGVLIDASASGDGAGGGVFPALSGAPAEADDELSPPERLRQVVAARQEESVKTLRDWLTRPEGEEAA